MLFPGSESTSYKLGNVDFNQKNVIAAGSWNEYPGKANFEKTIKNLYKNKMIDIEAETIYLKELVIGHVTPQFGKVEIFSACRINTL